MPTTIAVINESNAVTDAQVQAALPDFQTQVHRDFAPIWGADATLEFFSKNTAPPADAWQAVLLENSDQAGALGYHDLSPAGLPLSKIFVGTDKQYNESWSVTATHEILEMLGDPWINMVATTEDQNGAMTLRAYEACDACEDDSFGYTIGNTLVSDFVTPEWFSPGTKGPWDFKGHITAPLQLLKGGYIGIWTQTGGWTQQEAELIQPQIGVPTYSDETRLLLNRNRAPVGSRRYRRTIPRSRWVRSVRPS